MPKAWMRGVVKAVFYSALVVAAVLLLDWLLGEVELLSPLAAYSSYIDAALILILGYKAVSSIAEAVYLSALEVSDVGTAGSLRAITRIAGVAVLLSTLTSVFNVNPSAAITIGSFSGLVVGFATQNVLTQAVSGIFLAIARPFRIGDHVIIYNRSAGDPREGVVEDIGIMHTAIRCVDGSTRVLIPNNIVFNAIIIRKGEG